MTNLKSIIKFEFMRYFLSPLAYVYLVCFLLLSGSCAIYFGHFFMDGQANLWGLFDYQPWIYLLFIPGIAMRSWSDEFKSKTIVQILTTPVSLSNFILGKFLASWLFAIFAICLTFPFWITANKLGNPDNTVIFVSYLGCFALAGAMLAISQTMSALTKNSVIALVLAVFVNLLFFWSGFEYVLFWARELFSDVIVDTIISFSFLNHFSSLSRGLVELRDIVFFASLIIFFNLLTLMIISLKTKGDSGLFSSSELKRSATVFVLLFIGFFGLNIFANNVFREINYDFTEEKYLSLTKNTKDILRKLERPVVARLYYSPILEKRNPHMRQIFNQVKLMLRQFKTYSNGNFDFKIYNPKFLDKDEDKAIADGVQPIPLIDINQNALFGITFSDNLVGKSVIPFFTMERMPYLEQDLITGIYKMHHKKKTLGLFSRLPVSGNVQVESVHIEKWEIMKSIEELYDVQIIKNMKDLDKIYDVFMIIHPFGIEKDVAEKIKKQKKILLLMDVADEAAKLYSPASGKFIASDLGELADYWGIRFYDIGVAADFNNSITVDDTVNYKTNPSFTQDLLQFKLSENDFNPDHRITANLSSILFSSASMILPTGNTAVSYYPLLKTSNNSALISSKFVQDSVTPHEILENYKPSDRPIVLAAEFLSNDLNRPFDIIAVGDTDFIYDAFWTREQTFLDTRYNIPLFDSSNFILNSLDYLTGNDDLIILRGKNIKSRPLFVVDNMRKNNIYRYSLKESDIFKAINGAKQNLYQIMAKRNYEERGVFTPDELAVIGNIRNEIDDLRQQLSNLKSHAHLDIQKLEIKVKFFNIYFISILIVLLSLGMFLYKKRFLVNHKKSVLIFDKQLIKLILWIIGISVFAAASVYYDNKNSISKYENKLVFENFNEIMNSISKIKLKNGKQTLTFYMKDSIWHLEEYPQRLVYQERLNKLLFAISQMSYFEKKSNKVEDLKYFGFSDLDNDKSLMTSISLYQNQDKLLKHFDVGLHDFDLGRGSRGAFIKLLNQFQVWLVNVDFFNLDLDVDAWTYSSLWNLRYGRLISYNNITNNLKVMNLVKTLLNINIVDAVSNLKLKKIDTLIIRAENNNNVNLDFYKTKDERIYVTYDFMSLPEGKHLTFFAKYAKGKFFEISQDDWKKIKDATKNK